MKILVIIGEPKYIYIYIHISIYCITIVLRVLTHNLQCFTVVNCRTRASRDQAAFAASTKPDQANLDVTISGW